MKRFFFLFFLFSQAFAIQDSIVLFEDGFKSSAGVWSIRSHRQKSPSVIIWFHGGMQSPNCQKGLIAGKGLFELLNDSNIIVASPSACQNKHWLSPSLTSITDKLLDSLERHFNFSIKEVHLAGVSDGTLGVLAYSINGKRKVLSRLLISSNLSMLGDSQKISARIYTFDSILETVTSSHQTVTRTDEGSPRSRRPLGKRKHSFW